MEAIGSAKDMFNGSCFALVTGASQGLGRAVVLALSAAVGRNSVLAITARKEGDLRETANLAKAKRKQCGRSDEIKIVCVPADLADSKHVNSLAQSCMSGFQSKDFECAFLVHNAGSLGDITKEVCDFFDPEEVTDYLKLNVSHLAPLTAGFMKWRLPGNEGAKTVVINVTSLWAIQPTQCFSLYCTGKAAREMLFKVFASENPNVRVLNWSPGPLSTAMADKIAGSSNRYDSTKPIKDLKETGQLLTCEQSTTKLIEVLQKDEYESGAHVDYYD